MGNNIVFVINTLKVGGAAKMLRYVANLATELFDSVIIISIYDEKYTSIELKSEIKVIGLGFENVNRFKRQFQMVGIIRKTIQSISPKFVCAFVGHVNVMTRLATLGMHDVVVMSAERGDPYTQPWFWKRFTKWAYAKSDYCFFQLDKARDFFGPSILNRSFVIPNPFVTNKSVEPFLGIRKKTVVSAGRFGPEKCYDDLIDAFFIVHKKYPDYYLVLYGEGPMLPEYKKQVHRLGLDDYVSFPGYVSSVAEAIAQDGIFVLSSLYEGIPNSLIEAMSIGIPCVSTDCTPGGPAFLFNNQERGVLVNVHDIQAIAGAICKYIEDPIFAMDKGEKATDILHDLNESKIRQLWLQAFDIIKSNG